MEGGAVDSQKGPQKETSEEKLAKKTSQEPATPQGRTKRQATEEKVTNPKKHTRSVLGTEEAPLLLASVTPPRRKSNTGTVERFHVNLLSSPESAPEDIANRKSDRRRDRNAAPSDILQKPLFGQKYDDKDDIGKKGGFSPKKRADPEPRLSPQKNGSPRFRLSPRKHGSPRFGLSPRKNLSANLSPKKSKQKTGTEGGAGEDDDFDIFPNPFPMSAGKKKESKEKPEDEEGPELGPKSWTKAWTQESGEEDAFEDFPKPTNGKNKTSNNKNGFGEAGVFKGSEPPGFSPNKNLSPIKRRSAKNPRQKLGTNKEDDFEDFPNPFPTKDKIRFQD